MNKAATILPNIGVYAIRLFPGEDLIVRLKQIAEEKNISAGWIMSAVGSLTEYSIRFANQSQPSQSQGYFEVISIHGIVSTKGCHLHIMIGDEHGHVIGGHVSQGNLIYTTAEIIIGFTDQYTFDRKHDGTTLWKELSIEEKTTQ